MQTKPRLAAVALELTRYCNQKCDYCYNSWRANAQAAGAADDRWPVRIERLLAACDVDHFTLTGGEPFAYAGVFGVIEQIERAGVGFQCISNGGLFDDALAQRLASHRPRFVQVTLNGPDATLHEAHVGKGHFAPTLRGVAALRRHGVRVVGCVVVTADNARRVGEILALWERLDVQHIALSRFSPAGYAAQHVARLLPTQADVTRAFELALPFAQSRGMRIDCTMPIPPCAVEVERFAAIGFGGCAIGTSKQEFALGPDGRLRNCTLHGHVIAQAGDIANPEVDLATLLQHADVREYRRQVPAFCQGCKHAHSCGGGCGAAMQWVLGRRDTLPDPFVSQHVDPAFAERLQLARSHRRTRLEVLT